MNLSYTVVPLKEDTTYEQMSENLRSLFSYLKSTGVGMIIQDKFRESLIRKLGYLLEQSTQKLTLRQKIYDSQNSCDTFLYEYFRMAVLPAAVQGVRRRFCLQK